MERPVWQHLRGMACRQAATVSQVVGRKPGEILVRGQFRNAVLGRELRIGDSGVTVGPEPRLAALLAALLPAGQVQKFTVAYPMAIQIHRCLDLF